MGWGTVYEVPVSAGEQLRRCHTKNDWYEVLNELEIESSPQLNAEESIPFWASMLNKWNHPLAKFFEGDLRSEPDEYDDPSACFAGAESVSRALEQLDALGKQFFVELLQHDAPLGVGDSWLYEPLCEFLREVSERGNAVILLWES